MAPRDPFRLDFEPSQPRGSFVMTPASSRAKGLSGELDNVDSTRSSLDGANAQTRTRW